MDERSNHCFGCGDANAAGLRLQFDIRTAEDGILTSSASVELDRLYQGADGFIHGGILATLMDEAMSKLNRPLGTKAVTRHLEVDYILPSPINEPMIVTGKHLRREGRKLFHLAELRDSESRLLVKATGVFISVADMPAER